MGVCEGVAVGDVDCVGVCDGVSDGVGVGDGVSDGVDELLAEGEGRADGDGRIEAEEQADGEGHADAVADLDTDTDTERVRLREAVRQVEVVAERERVLVTEREREPVADFVGCGRARPTNTRKTSRASRNALRGDGTAGKPPRMRERGGASSARECEEQARLCCAMESFSLRAVSPEGGACALAR